MALTAYPGVTDLSAKVSRRKLFKPRVKRIAIPASDEHVNSEAGGTYVVSESISYTVSLKRIAKK